MDDKPKTTTPIVDINCYDTELIECKECQSILNGVSFWIVEKRQEFIYVCENCYKELYK